MLRDIHSMVMSASIATQNPLQTPGRHHSESPPRPRGRSTVAPARSAAASTRRHSKMVSGSTVLRAAAQDYEAHLRHLYTDLAALYGSHAPHQTTPATVTVHAVGGKHMRIAAPGEHEPVPAATCMVNDRCDELADRSAALILAEFPEDTAAELFETAVAFIDVRFSVHAHSVREACVEALLYDAELNRLFPDGALMPVDPATTQPELYENAVGD